MGERSAEGDVVLTGGLSTPVVLRRGDAVHRTAGPWTPTVHRLLDHLHRAGVTFVPRALGMDEAGREVLSHLPGWVPTYPVPAPVWSRRVLVTAARQLAQVHAATRSFPAAEEAAGRTSTWQEAGRLPAEVVCLNDVGPYNMVFSGGPDGEDDDVDVTGWIDLDTAAPGPRAWDLAHLAYRLVPLTSADYTGSGPADLERYRRRLLLLCDTYAEAGDGTSVPPEEVLSSFVDVLQHSAATADRRFADGATELDGHGDFYRREVQWLLESASALLGWGTDTTAAPVEHP